MERSSSLLGSADAPSEHCKTSWFRVRGTDFALFLTEIHIRNYAMCSWFSDMSPEEIKKIKAIESDQYPHPHTIKQCLGENLGDVVIDMISEDLLRRMQFEGGAMPRKFGVTAKNMLLGNVKLTTAADDGVDESKALNADTIIRKLRTA